MCLCQVPAAPGVGHLVPPVPEQGWEGSQALALITVEFGDKLKDGELKCCDRTQTTPRAPSPPAASSRPLQRFRGHFPAWAGSGGTPVTSPVPGQPRLSVELPVITSSSAEKGSTMSWQSLPVPPKFLGGLAARLALVVAQGGVAEVWTSSHAKKPVTQLGEHLSWGRAGLGCGEGTGRGESSPSHPSPSSSSSFSFSWGGQSRLSCLSVPGVSLHTGRQLWRGRREIFPCSSG